VAILHALVVTGPTSAGIGIWEPQTPNTEIQISRRRTMPYNRVMQVLREATNVIVFGIVTILLNMLISFLLVLFTACEVPMLGLCPSIGFIFLVFFLPPYVLVLFAILGIACFYGARIIAGKNISFALFLRSMIIFGSIGYTIILLIFMALGSLGLGWRNLLSPSFWLLGLPFAMIVNAVRLRIYGALNNIG
jgi:hypothetical protein